MAVADTDPLMATKVRRTRRRAVRASETTPAKNVSWLPGRKGQGGEGLSKGYGGSAGRGTGAAGPERARADASTKRKAKHGRGARVPER